MLDPNIKLIVYHRICSILKSGCNSDIDSNLEIINAIRQYIKNILNICDTYDQIYYVIPNTLKKSIESYIYSTSTSLDLETNKVFIKKFNDIKSKSTEELNNINKLVVKYKLTR